MTAHDESREAAAPLPPTHNNHVVADEPPSAGLSTPPEEVNGACTFLLAGAGQRARIMQDLTSRTQENGRGRSRWNRRRLRQPHWYVSRSTHLAFPSPYAPSVILLSAQRCFTTSCTTLCEIPMVGAASVGSHAILEDLPSAQARYLDPPPLWLGVPGLPCSA